MIIGLRILIWLMLALLLTTCALQQPDAPPSGPGLGSGPTDRDSLVTRGPATFSESYRWTDGLSVDVVAINHGRLPASTPVDLPTAQPGDPTSELTVVVRNESDRMARVALTARLRYGPDQVSAGTYVATAGHADHATAQYIASGAVSYPYTLGFVLPEQARDDVVLELVVDNWLHEPAVFAGSVAVG